MKQLTKLPKKWCINKYYREVAEYAKERFNDSSYVTQTESTYWHFPKKGYCCTSSYKYDGYTEITFEDFKRLVLKEKTQTMKETKWKIGDKLPITSKRVKYHYSSWTSTQYNKGWYTLDILDSNNQKITGFIKYNKIDCAIIDKDTYIPITELDRIYPNLKQNNTMKKNKVIIGYNIKDGFYKGDIAQALDTSSAPVNNTYWMSSNGSVYDKAITLKVLNLWFEPVYGEEIKLPKILNYQGTEQGNLIVYGCRTFFKSQYKELYKLMTTFGIKSYKIEAGEVKYEEIKAINNYITKKK